jgi:hypothetical protein
MLAAHPPPLAGKYPEFQYIIAQINETAQTENTSHLILNLYGFIKKLEDKGREKKEDPPEKEIKKTANEHAV